MVDKYGVIYVNVSLYLETDVEILSLKESVIASIGMRSLKV